MTTTAPRPTKTPTLAAISAEFTADQELVDTTAAAATKSVQSALQAQQAVFDNPMGFSPEETSKILVAAMVAEKHAKLFSPDNVGYLKRQRAERFFPERKDIIVLAANAGLAEKLAPREGYIQALTKWFREVASPIFTKTLSNAEREEILAERDRREDSALVLESYVAEARRCIARFEANPTQEHYGAICGALSIVNFV